MVGYAGIHHALRHLRGIQPHWALYVLLIRHVVLLLLLYVVVLGRSTVASNSLIVADMSWICVFERTVMGRVLPLR